jgi:hypothetical protein
MSFPSFATGEVLTAADMNAVGLWRTGGGTLSSSATNFAGCFSADYDAYRLVIVDLATNGTDPITIQLLSGTTPAATNYDYQRLFVQGATVGGGRSTAQTSMIIGYTATSVVQGFQYDIFNVFAAKRTQFYGGESYNDGTNINIEMTSGQHTTATSYTGLRVLCGANTFTSGKVMIYGYRQP